MKILLIIAVTLANSLLWNAISRRVNGRAVSLREYMPMSVCVAINLEFIDWVYAP